MSSRGSWFFGDKVQYAKLSRSLFREDIATMSIRPQLQLHSCNEKSDLSSSNSKPLVDSGVIELSSPDTDVEDNENATAPIELLSEFLSAVMSRDYESALKYCKMILQYEPGNKIVQEFYPLIEEKLQQVKEEGVKNSLNKNEDKCGSDVDTDDSENEDIAVNEDLTSDTEPHDIHSSDDTDSDEQTLDSTSGDYTSADGGGWTSTFNTDSESTEKEDDDTDTDNNSNPKTHHQTSQLPSPDACANNLQELSL